MLIKVVVVVIAVVVLRIEKKLEIRDCVDLHMKGVRCFRYYSVRRLIGTLRSVRVARELSEDSGIEGGVYLINFKGVKVIVLPDHVHVLGDVTVEKAEEIVKELEELLSKEPAKAK